MIYFNNDYSEGCHEKVLSRLVQTNLEQTLGYGEDEHCAHAAELIRKKCGRDDLAVHFLVGGTQANLTVIDAALRPHQGALGPDTAHINVHETGAVEATGHKVLWVPHQDGTSLYIRPTMIATDAHLGVHASTTYLFYIILSPVGAYYKEGLKPVGIYVEDEYVRAVRGGVGFTKCAGNYAASILAGEVAEQKGYAQVLWLDGVEQKYVEEVGSMNMMFAYGNKIVTPMLNGSILPGITRDSILTLARQLGFEVEEKRLAIADIFEDAKAGRLTEAFGTVTAAVISPVGHVEGDGIDITFPDGSETSGPVMKKLRATLTDIQQCKIEGPEGWVCVIQ